MQEFMEIDAALDCNLFKLLNNIDNENKVICLIYRNIKWQ